MKGKLLIFFFVLNYTCMSQVSGYMGKRFIIGYSNYFMVASQGLTANASSTDNFSGVNTTHCLNLEYVIKNKTNFCVSVQTLKTGVYTSKTFSGYTVDEFGDNQYYYYSYDPKPFIPMQLQNVNVGLGFKFYKQGMLAPIGKYKKLELLLMFSHLTYDRNAFTYYYNSSTGLNGVGGTGDYQFNTFAITFTMGRSRVLFDKIVLDYGLRLGITPAGIFAYLNSDGDFSFKNNGEITFEQSMKQEVNKRLFRDQLINLHIGLSFLAF